MAIVRDMVFKNHKYFHMLMKSLGGISTNILSDRLQKLEENGFIHKSKDLHDGRKTHYSLTEKGLELIPILIELIIFGSKLGYEDFPKSIINEIKSNRSQLISKLKQQHKPNSSKPIFVKKRPSSQLSQTLSLFD